MRRREDIVQAIKGTVEPYASDRTGKQQFPRVAIGAPDRAGALSLTVSRRSGGSGQERRKRTRTPRRAEPSPYA